MFELVRGGAVPSEPSTSATCHKMELGLRLLEHYCDNRPCGRQRDPIAANETTLEEFLMRRQQMLLRRNEELKFIKWCSGGYEMEMRPRDVHVYSVKLHNVWNRNKGVQNIFLINAPSIFIYLFDLFH